MTPKARYFNEVYLHYFDRCVLFARSYLFDADVAQDIVAESMMTFWEKLCAGEAIAQPVPFLFGIIRNGVLHHLRHEQVKIRVHQDLGSDEARELDFRISTLEACDPSGLYSKEVQEILQRSLAAMSEQTRRVFVMSRFEGRSAKEIAAALGISVKGVDYHITKSLKQLRIDLRDYLTALVFFL